MRLANETFRSVPERVLTFTLSRIVQNSMPFSLPATHLLSCKQLLPAQLTPLLTIYRADSDGEPLLAGFPPLFGFQRFNPSIAISVSVPMFSDSTSVGPVARLSSSTPRLTW